MEVWASLWPHDQPQTDVEHMETLLSKSVGKQMGWSENVYKISKMGLKIFVYLFVYSAANFDMHDPFPFF